MSTFLELCQDYRAEIGIPGNGPVTTIGQIGELSRVVLDIQSADQDIKRQWQDWDFMWKQFTTTTIIGSPWLTALKPADYRRYDLNSVWIDKGTNSAYNLEFVPYKTWKNDQGVGVIPSGTPTDFTVLPNGEIRVYPTPTQAHTVNADYWMKAARLSSNSEESVVPEEYHRIIIVRAKIIYAEREDAPEIMAGASAEYDSLMSLLEADYLPAQADGKQGAVNQPRTVVVE